MTSDVTSPSLVSVFYCCWERGGMAWVAPSLSALKLLQLLGCWQREPCEGAN